MRKAFPVCFLYANVKSKAFYKKLVSKVVKIRKSKLLSGIYYGQSITAKHYVTPI